MTSKPNKTNDLIGKQVTTRGDCSIIQIPSGIEAMLYGGTDVTIMQIHSTYFTVRLDQYGFYVRVDGEDAHVLCEEAIQAYEPPVFENPEDMEKNVWDQLGTCYDPEIPVDIVNLGLIYNCEVNKKDGHVNIEMTLTAPGCGMSQVIADDVKRTVSKVPGVKWVNVDLVFYPTWSPEMMSEAARLQTGMM